MSRIRSVKPELFRHEALFEAERESQLPLRIAFVGLFTCCDREGRFRWRPRQLKLDAAPYDDIDFSRVLDALAEHGFILKYEVAGQFYGCIPSWRKHQCINNKEMPSQLPAFEEGHPCPLESSQAETSQYNEVPESCDPCVNDASSTRASRVDDALITRNQSSLESLRNSQGEYGIGKGNREEEYGIGSMEGEEERKKEKQAKEKSGNGNGNGKEIIAQTQIPSANNDILSIFEHWKNCLNYPNAKLDSKRKSLIKQALKLGYSVSDLYNAITGCSYTPHNMGNNEQGQRYDGLQIIFRDADQIDRFIRNARSPPKPLTTLERSTEANVNVLKNWLNKKMKEE
jgi:hypothetical protein